jgi:hypothetical protein
MSADKKEVQKAEIDLTIVLATGFGAGMLGACAGILGGTIGMILGAIIGYWAQTCVKKPQC